MLIIWKVVLVLLSIGGFWIAAAWVTDCADGKFQQADLAVTAAFIAISICSIIALAVI